MRTLEKITIAPKPLPNFSGAACWWNSMLQLTMSIPQIYDILKENYANCNDLAKGYVLFVENKLTNSQLFAIFTKAVPGLNHGQQCAREGFECFIDQLKSEEVEQLLNVGIRKIVKCPKCGRNNGVNPHDPKARTNNIVLNYYHNPKVTDLDSFIEAICISNYELEWKCENTECDSFNVIQKVEATDRLTRVNPVIMVHMNKYVSKPNQYFPETFELNQQKEGVYKYILLGTIEHSGNMYGGHYCARGVRNSDSKIMMMNFNDAARPVPCKSNPLPATVMLAYVMIKS